MVWALALIISLKTIKSSALASISISKFVIVQTRIVLFRDTLIEFGHSIIKKSCNEKGNIMAKLALVPVANGSEEIEVVSIIDILPFPV